MPSANVLTFPELVKPYSPWKCCNLTKNKEVIRQSKGKSIIVSHHDYFFEIIFLYFPGSGLLSFNIQRSTEKLCVDTDMQKQF